MGGRGRGKIRCGRNYANREYVLFAYGLSFLFRFKTNTHFCRETTRNVKYALFGIFFDSDKCDLTQTLLRHLVKKMVSGASDVGR